MELKKAIMTIGRFQPITIAHEILINDVCREKGDSFIFTTPTFDLQNPLSIDSKLRFLKLIYPSIRFEVVNDAFSSLEFLNSLGYQHVRLICGADRIPKYQDFFKYVGKEKPLSNIQYLELVDSGNRDPDSDTLSGISASKARYAVKENNYEKFCSMIPSILDEKHKKELYNLCKAGMGLSWEH